MDEALLKQNTDCVYFLASPLTCKKGAECEYRHSNLARLNPEECWYWFAGNCLHPTCAFRHPPLDGHVGAPLESARSSVSATKSSVPCYFYFKGFCNKGGKCSFLHDTDGAASTGTSAKTATACKEVLAHPSESKTSSGNDTLSAPRMTHLNPSETASNAVDAEFQPVEVLLPYHKQPAVRTVEHKSVSPEISVSGDEEDGEIRSDSPQAEGSFHRKSHSCIPYHKQPVFRDVEQKSVSPEMSVSGDEEDGEIRSDSAPAEGSIHRKSHSYADESSEEQEDDILVSEEWREASPAKREYLSCEVDPEYFLTLDGEQRKMSSHFFGERRELNGHFLGYGFENPEEYDPAYPDAELLYERDIYSSYSCLDNRFAFGNDREFSSYTKERMSDSIFPCKRKFTSMELAADEQDLLDLRDRLRRRRMTDGLSLTGSSSRSQESLRLFGRVGQMPQRHATAWPLHGSLASEVGRSSYEPLNGNVTCFDGGIQHGSLRYAQQHRHTKHQKKRRLTMNKKHGSLRYSQQLPPWVVLRKPVLPREKRCAQRSPALAHMKQEKRKAEETRGCIGIREHGRRTKVDFQGPKPLNEILKEKGKAVRATTTEER